MALHDFWLIYQNSVRNIFIMTGRRNFNQSRDSGTFNFLRFQINHFISNEINLLRYYLFDYFFPKHQNSKSWRFRPNPNRIFSFISLNYCNKWSVNGLILIKIADHGLNRGFRKYRGFWLKNLSESP